ncbi:TetR/AcrR family transcriptional regulator [Kiloniella sp. EL199]|uniref:TetR/AcrR family transcriptional regulator n=1 Tax=Kiloniella sp. EL199 TaxID=2107581 RepID=UPI000EA369B1|nr:TetR/AcrR family transcriptional regulator [Kiloniella sp. EL199]
MGRGRPRKTDPEEVLDTAMKVFWSKGFEGTSMSDLVCATGMAKPGLYACFGDKESLYKKSLARYYNNLGMPLLDDLKNSDDVLSVVVRRFLESVAKSMLDKDCPSGCFVVNSLVEESSQHPELETITKEYDQKRRDIFVTRFEQAQKNGELPQNTDAKALGEFFSAQSLALGVLGRTNADKKELNSFIDIAMTALPNP